MDVYYILLWLFSFWQIKYDDDDDDDVELHAW